MTIDELIAKLTIWRETEGGGAHLRSDFGVVEVHLKPKLNVNIEQEGTPVPPNDPIIANE